MVVVRFVLNCPIASDVSRNTSHDGTAQSAMAIATMMFAAEGNHTSCFVCCNDKQDYQDHSARASDSSQGNRRNLQEKR